MHIVNLWKKYETFFLVDTFKILDINEWGLRSKYQLQPVDLLCNPTEEI